LSDLRLRVEETSDLKKKGENSKKGGYNPYRSKKQGKPAKKETKIRNGLGLSPVARGKQSTMFVGWARDNSPNNELSPTGAQQAEGL